jgi:hypothetical protein
MIWSDASTNKISIGSITSAGGSTFGVTGDITATSHITGSGNLEIAGNISGSSTTTGSFGSVVVSDKVQGNLKIGEGIVYDDTNKRLGIGDPVPTSPESELHIKAATPEITIQRTDNNNDGVIDFQGSAGYVGAKIAHSGTDNNLVFHTYTGSTLKERLTITGGSAGTKISGSAVSTGSFGHLIIQGNVTASGTIRADAFQSVTGGTTIDFNDSLDIAGDVTASGAISASGNLSATGNLDIDGTSNFAGITKITDTTNSTSTSTGALIIDGGVGIVKDLVVGGIVIAQEFHTEFVSASIQYTSGSTQFGNTEDDTHTFSGSLFLNSGTVDEFTISGSGLLSGSYTTTGSFGRVSTAGDIYTSGRIYESGTSVVDHATAMAIVFGG